MGNCPELVCRKIVSTKTKGLEVERYFDGTRSLGGVDKLAKMAQIYYNLSTQDLMAACGTDRKTVRNWIRGKVIPQKPTVDKILAAIELAKRFHQELTEIPKVKKVLDISAPI